MPSSLFADMERHGGGGGGETLDDQRALQIALDQLSLLGLDSDETGSFYENEPRKKSVNMTECVPVPSSEHVAEIVGRQGCKIKALRAKTNTYIKTPVRGEEPLFVVTGRKEDVAMARREIISAAEHFSMIRASRNKSTVLNGSVPSPPNLPGQTTIQVRVPYRVVGLVVGPKGATIKRIQQQTHTYIVTPSRDKEPVFEVTGMPENVDRAREEIEAHIAMRTGGLIELIDDNDFHANGTDVGFELGGGGAGSLWSKPTPSITPTPARKPFCSYRNDSSSSLGSASTDSYFGGSARLADYSPPSPAALGFPPNGNAAPASTTTTNGYGVYGSPAESGDGCPAEPPPPFDSPPGFDLAPAPPPQLLWSQYERAHLASSPAAFPGSPAAPPANLALLVSGGQQRRGVPQAPPPTRLSPPLHSAPGGGALAGPEQHPLARRVRSDPGGRFLAAAAAAASCCSSSSSSSSSSSCSYPLYANGLGCHLPGLPSDCSPPPPSSSSSSASSSSSSSSCSSSGLRRKGSRDCSVCFESEVIAALVPCGHNLFCMECANRICERNEPQCPVCHSAVTQAIRIFS
ncbi:RNA-binding protein MEX3B isoform X2 [Pseudonaja textilis]|uniref:RNA-binding protein MEX3B isoform X2 n=1 Tax=Pseudonaja textilis TaxID=8673 RepID=UPI000EA8695E|nr:RNA-binding protein MEX3B isoform X2 [Pseudonaja textilis]